MMNINQIPAYLGGAVFRLGLGVVVLGGIVRLGHIIGVGGEGGAPTVAMLHAFAVAKYNIKAGSTCQVPRVRWELVGKSSAW